MNSNESVRVFQSDFLEKFTKVHPIIPLLMWGPVSAYFFYRAIVIDALSVSMVLGLSLFAVFVWTLFEYLLHRFAFHLEGETGWRKRFTFIVHGLHHDAPNDRMRLVMPPFPAVVLAAILYPTFRLFWGPVLVDPFFAGFTLAYLWYDYTHYAIHHFKPITRYGKFIKQYHMVHHFVHGESKFGVSNPLWDYVFRTEGAPTRSVARTPGVKTEAHLES